MSENEIEVLGKISLLLKKWDYLSKLIHRGICILGVAAIAGTLFVSTFIGENDIIHIWLLKTVSCVSSTCLAMITAFNMVAHRNKYRNAWRLLNSKYLLFEAGFLKLEELIAYYEKAEEIIGNLNFSYNQLNSHDADLSKINSKHDAQKS